LLRKASSILKRIENRECILEVIDVDEEVGYRSRLNNKISTGWTQSLIKALMVLLHVSNLHHEKKPRTDVQG
jgi:hypothetical protein